MAHLKPAELMLYWGKTLSPDRQKTLAEHLRRCNSCRGRLQVLKSKLQSMRSDNQRQCRRFQRMMLQHIDGALDDVQRSQFAQHLDDCPRCSHLYRIFRNLSTGEYSDQADIEIPEISRARIESTVTEALRKSNPVPRLKPQKEELLDHFQTAARRLILRFYPLQPALKFRGETDDLCVIEHAGGDLILETGLKNVTIELTNIFEEFTLKAMTDENGDVIFKELVRGEYVPSTDGYRLGEMKIKESP
ncbi:zf-HC2 domain-containing protein [candidate division KSB1 bacterium]|nr:zf-HC2 domain-containing protein [candidate division KSB1 bacterium]